MNNNTFHLGITMAGAVSAGAYTAGFMDYILEALQLWEEKKEINRKLGEDHTDYDKTIPMHDVVIDVVGGASAGGMVSTMTALSMYNKMPHIKEASYKKTGNLLYDSWVLLDDDLKDNKPDKNGKTTFEKMLDTSDFENSSQGIESLLNTQPIDNIADKIFDEFSKDTEKAIDFPSYISKDLRVLVTLTSLRGISFEVGFSRILSKNFNEAPAHTMHEHMIIAHFKTNYSDKGDKSNYLNFNPYKDKTRNLIKKCTKGTGSFPIGLKARHFEDEIHTDYIKASLKRNLATSNDPDVTINIKEKHFNFTNIDGGLINNEPYGEVVQILEELYPDYNKEQPMYGTIMIDPFPKFDDTKSDNLNTDKEKKEGFFQKDMFGVLSKLFGTLKEQARVKRGDSFYNDKYRLMSFPIKWKYNKSEKEWEEHKHPLACGGLGGFGGFFDIEFRIHDFFLGRNNARNFIRMYLTLEHDNNNLHSLFQNLTPEASKMFKKTAEDSQTQKKSTYMPIIPDMNYIEGNRNPYHYTYKELPKLNVGYFNTLKKPIKRRIKTMLKYEINRRFKTKWFLRNAFKLVTGYLSRKATDKVSNIILDDFRKRNMI